VGRDWALIPGRASALIDSCNARTRRGTRCNKPALPGKLRCNLHGGLSTWARTPEGRARQIEARTAGRRRWVERMRRAKAAGLIERFPNGRRAKGLPPRSKDRIIARGQRIVDMVVEAMDKMLPEVPDKPLEQQSDAELFAGNFRRSLLFSRRVLDRPDDWDNVEFMKTKREVALAVQGQAVRLRVAELRPPGDDSVVSRMMQKIAAIRRGEKVIEIDPGEVSE